MQIEDLKVTLGQNMKVKVNHKRVSLPFVSLGTLSIHQEGYSVVVRTNLGNYLNLDHPQFPIISILSRFFFLFSNSNFFLNFQIQIYYLNFQIEIFF